MTKTSNKYTYQFLINLINYSTEMTERSRPRYVQKIFNCRKKYQTIYYDIELVNFLTHVSNGSILKACHHEKDTKNIKI